MATSKFRPIEVPQQVSPEIRDYLDRMLTEMAVLLDGAADYIDAADTIAHTDAAETITAAWTFDTTLTVRSQLQLFDGFQLRVYEATNVNFWRAYHDGSNAIYDTTLGKHWFSDPVLVYGGGESIILRDDTTGVGVNAWIQWQDSAATNIGYVGFGSGANNTLYVNNQVSGGDIMLALSGAGDVHINAAATGGLHITGSSYKTNPTGVRVGQYTSTLGYIQTPSSTGTIDVWDGATNAIARFSYNSILLRQPVQIDTDQSSMLTIGDGAGADGDILINFDMDRGFRFMQYSTGANTGLNLRSQTDGKYFRITSTSADAVIGRFYGNTAGVSYFDVGSTDDSYAVTQRWWSNSTNSGYYGQAHCRTAAQSPTHLTTIGNAGGPFWNMQAAGVADDATVTFSIDTYSMVFIINSYNGSTYAHLGFAGTQAPVNYGSGSNVVTGATNPDTDGKLNVWPSATGVMSIKNRMGLAISIYVISLDRN